MEKFCYVADALSRCRALRLVHVNTSMAAMEGFEERLAEEVRKYPHLYDSSRRDYKDIQKTSNSWSEIARNLGTNEANCRQKWKNLRDRYTKAKKRMKSRSGDAGGKSVPPIFYSLSWMSIHVKHRDTETNFREDTQSQMFDEESQETSLASESLATAPVSPYDGDFETLNVDDFDPMVNSPSTNRSESMGNSSSCSTPTLPTTPVSNGVNFPSRNLSKKPLANSEKNYRKRPSPAEAAIMERLDTLKKIREERQTPQMDEERRFAETIADMLRKLPNKMKSEAKFAIHKVLFEMEQKLYENIVDQ